jgi:hydroxyethylthiazole kinase
MHAPHLEFANSAADVLERVRERRPCVHCITNTVAQSFTANALLALGAVPSMTISPDEIATFVAQADALLVNLGTLDAERREACEIAIEEVGEAGAPWVLDPVFIDRSQPRAAFAKTLVTRRPRALRLNGAEFTTLAGADANVETIARFALDHQCVVGLTGVSDIVDDGRRRAVIANGDALMAKVTAMGCVASALVAACLAVDGDAWRATTAGLTMLGVAGEVAATRAQGPGSFAVAIIDALHRLDRQTLSQQARVTS